MTEADRQRQFKPLRIRDSAAFRRRQVLAGIE